MSEDGWGLSERFETYLNQRAAKQQEVTAALHNHRQMNGSGQVPIPPQVPAYTPSHLTMPVVPEQQTQLASVQLVACAYCGNQGIFNCGVCSQLICQGHMNPDGTMCGNCQSRLDADMQASLQKYDQEHPEVPLVPTESPIATPAPMPVPGQPSGNREQIANYHLVSMHAADRELWDRIMESESFSYHFNELLKMAIGK